MRCTRRPRMPTTCTRSAPAGHGEGQPTDPARPVEGAALEGRPGRTHRHRPRPRTDRKAPPEGRHRPGRTRLPPHRPGQPGHPHLPPDQQTGQRTTASATACGGRPSTRSRPCPPSRPTLPSWPPKSVDSGRLRTGCIGSETSRSVRIFTRPAPAAAPKAWLRYATWSSVCCASQAIPTLPEPYASTPVIPIKPSPS